MGQMGSVRDVYNQFDISYVKQRSEKKMSLHRLHSMELVYLATFQYSSLVGTCR